MSRGKEYANIIWEFEQGILSPYEFVKKVKEYDEENKELIKLLRTKLARLRKKLWKRNLGKTDI